MYDRGHGWRLISGSLDVRIFANEVNNSIKKGCIMILIGEDLNVMSKQISLAIKERNPEPIRECVTGQTQSGMDYLDLNVGPVTKEPVETIQWLVKTVQGSLKPAKKRP
jgi:cobalamin-dependent methionine synthase I